MSRHINKEERTNYSDPESISKGPGGPDDTRLKDEDGKFTAGEVLAPGSKRTHTYRFRSDGLSVDLLIQNESEDKKAPDIAKSKENEFDDGITTPIAFSALASMMHRMIARGAYGGSQGSDSVSLMRSNAWFDRVMGIDFFVMRGGSILDTYDVKLSEAANKTFPFNILKSYGGKRAIIGSSLNVKAQKQMFVTPNYADASIKHSNALVKKDEAGGSVAAISPTADIIEMESKGLAKELGSIMATAPLLNGKGAMEAARDFVLAKDEESEKAAMSGTGAFFEIIEGGIRKYTISGKNLPGMPEGSSLLMAYYPGKDQRSVRVFLPKAYFEGRDFVKSCRKIPVRDI